MIRCVEVTKIFRKNGSEVTSLDRFTAEIAEGEFDGVLISHPGGSCSTRKPTKNSAAPFISGYAVSARKSRSPENR